MADKKGGHLTKRKLEAAGHINKPNPSNAKLVYEGG